MKKVSLALALILGLMACPAEAYNVFAPNSFDSARMNSFEYQTLRTMTKEGKIPHYKVTYFNRGDNISRYELADVLIDALDNGQGMTAEDLQNLKKIKKSYSRELDAKGWKDPNPEPESKDPIIEIHGDVRIREREGYGADGRMRVGAKYNLNRNTAIHIGGEADTD
jgi:hypothetical protein